MVFDLCELYGKVSLMMLKMNRGRHGRNFGFVPEQHSNYFFLTGILNAC